MNEITVEDEKDYGNFFRLLKNQFQFVADKVRPEMQRENGGTGEEGSGRAWRQVYQTVNKLMSQMFLRMNEPESQQRGTYEFSSGR